MNKPTMQGRRLLALLLALLMLVTMVPAAALAEAIEAVVPAATVEQQQDVTQAPEAGLPELSTDKAAAKATSLKAVKINSKSFKQNGTAKLTLTTKNAVAAFVTVDNKTELPEDLTDAVAIKKNKATIKLPVVGLEKGSHQLYVWLQDKDGNWAQRGKKVTIKLTQKPAVVEEPVVEEPSEAEAKEEGALEIAPVILPELASESAEALPQDGLMAVSRATDYTSTLIQSIAITGVDTGAYYPNGFGLITGKVYFMDIAAGGLSGTVFFDLGLDHDDAENRPCAYTANCDVVVEQTSGTITPGTTLHTAPVFHPTDTHESYNGTGHYLTITAASIQQVGTVQYEIRSKNLPPYAQTTNPPKDTITVIIFNSSLTATNFVGVDVGANGNPSSNNYVFDLKGEDNLSRSLEYFIRYKGILSNRIGFMDAHIIQDDDPSILNKIATPNWKNAKYLYNGTGETEFLYQDTINVVVDQNDVGKTYKFKLEMTIDGEVRDADFTVHVVDSTKSPIGPLLVHETGADSSVIYLADLDPSSNSSTLSYTLNLNQIGAVLPIDNTKTNMGTAVVSFKSGFDVATPSVDQLVEDGATGNYGLTAEHGITMTAKPGMAGKSGVYTLTLSVNGVVRTCDFTVSVSNPFGDGNVLIDLNFKNLDTEGVTILDLKGAASVQSDLLYEYIVKGTAEELNKLYASLNIGDHENNLATVTGLTGGLNQFEIDGSVVPGVWRGTGLVKLSAAKADVGRYLNYMLTLVFNDESISIPFAVKVIDSYAPDYLGLAADSLVINFAGENGPLTKTTNYTISSIGELYTPPTAFDYLTATKNSGDAALAVTVNQPTPIDDGAGKFYFNKGSTISVIANRADIGKTATYDLAVSINGVVHTTQFNVQVIDSSMDLIKSLDVYADKTLSTDSNTIYLKNATGVNTSTLSYKVNLNGVGATLPNTANVSAPTIKYIGGAGYEDVADVSAAIMSVGIPSYYTTAQGGITMTARPGMAGKTGLYRLTYVINGVEISDDFEVRVANVQGGDTELVMLNFVGMLLGENTILDLKGANSITGMIDFEFNMKGNLADINDIKASVNTDKYTRNLVSSVQLVGGLTPMASAPGAAIGGGEINLIATKADVGTQLEYLLSLTFNGKTMSIPFVVTVVDSYDANYTALRNLNSDNLVIDFDGGNVVVLADRQAEYSISADNMLVKSNTAFGALSANYSSGDTPAFPATVAVPDEVAASGPDPLDPGYIPAHYETTGLITFSPTRADIGKTVVYEVSVEINGVVHTTPITVSVIDSAMDNVLGLNVSPDPTTLLVTNTEPQPDGTLNYSVLWRDLTTKYVYNISTAHFALVSGEDVVSITNTPTIPGTSDDGTGTITLKAYTGMAGKSGTYRMTLIVNGVTVTDTFTVNVLSTYGESGFVGFHVLNSDNGNGTLVDDAVLDLKGADSVAGKLTFEFFYRGIVADIKDVETALDKVSGTANFAQSVTLKTLEPYKGDLGFWYGTGEINLTAVREEIDMKDTYALTLTVNGKSKTLTFTVAAVDSTNGNGLLSLTLDNDVDNALIDMAGKTNATTTIGFKYSYDGNLAQLNSAIAEAISQIPGGHLVTGVELGKVAQFPVNGKDVWVGLGTIHIAAIRSDIGTQELYDLNVTINGKTLTAPFTVTVFDSTNGNGLIAFSHDDARDAVIDLAGETSKTQQIKLKYIYSGNYQQLENAVADYLLKSGYDLVNGVDLQMPVPYDASGNPITGTPPTDSPIFWFGTCVVTATATREHINTQSNYDVTLSISGDSMKTGLTISVIDSTNGNGLLSLTLEDVANAFIDMEGLDSKTAEVGFKYTYSGNYAQLESAVAEAVKKAAGNHLVTGVELGKVDLFPVPVPNGPEIWVGVGRIKIAATRADIDTQEEYDLKVSINDKSLTAPFTVVVFDSTNGEGLISLTLNHTEKLLIDLQGKDSEIVKLDFDYIYVGNEKQLKDAVANAVLKAGKGYTVTGVEIETPQPTAVGTNVMIGKGYVTIAVTRADIDTYSTYTLNMTVNGKTLTSDFTVVVIDSTNGKGIVALDMNHAANDDVIDLKGKLTQDGSINFRYIYTGNFKDIENFETKLTLIDPAGNGPTHSITMGQIASMTGAAPSNAWVGEGTINLLAAQEDVGKRFTYELSMRVKGTDQYITQTFSVLVIDTNTVMITPVSPLPDATNGHYYLFVGETLKVQYSIPYYQNLVGKIWNVTSTDFATASAASSYDDATNPKTLFGDVSIYGKAVGTGTHTLSIDGKPISFTVTVYPKLDNNNVRLDPASATLTLRNDGSEKQVFTIKAPDGVKIDDYDIVWTVTGVDKNGNPTISVFGQGKTATVTGLNYGQGIVTATLTAPKTTGVTTPAEIILSAPVTVADRNLAKLIVTDAGRADAVKMANMEARQTIHLEKIVDYHFVHYIDGEWADPNADEAFPGAVTYDYASSNPSVATVDGNGWVTCVGAGDAIITVTGTYLSKYGETYEQSIDFRVHVGSNKITIDPNKFFELFPGDIKDINYETEINVALDSYPKISWRIDRVGGLSTDFYNASNNAKVMRWEKDGSQLVLSDEAPAGDYVLTLMLIGQGKEVKPIRSEGDGSYILIKEYDDPITGYDYPIDAGDKIIAASTVTFRILAKPQKVLVDDTLGNAKPQNVTAAQLAADYTAAYPKTLTMSFIGKTAKLKATVLPNESYLQSVTWYSVDPKVAMVDPVTGVVTATGAGTTQVYAKTTVAGLKDRDQIDEGYIIIESVGKANIFTLDPSYKEILVNGKVQIVPYFVDIDGIDKARQVKVEYEALDVVTGAGTTASGESYVKLHSWFDRETNKWLLDVTGVKPGEVVIKATIFKGTSEEQAAFSTIVINEAVTEISATRKHLTIAVGQQYMYDLLGTLTFNGKAGKDTSYLNTDVTVTVMDPSVVAIDKEDYSYILGLKIGTTMIKVRSVENQNVYCDILVDVVDIAQFLYTDVESIQVYEGTSVPVSITSKLDTVYGALTWTYQDYAGKAFDGIAPGTGELIAWYDANNKQVVANKAGYVELIATAKLPTDLYDTYYNGLYIGNYMPPEARLKIRVTVLKKAETVKIDFLNDRALESLVTPVKVTINGRERYKVEFPVGSRFILHASVAPDTTYDKELVWTSSDPKVASVDAFGIVTVRKSGTVHIYATAKSGVQDIFVVNAIPTDRAQLGITTECAVPIYRTADTSDRVAYLKQGITFVIAGKEGKYYKIEYGVGDLDYAYVKKDKVEIVSDTDTITGSPVGMITTTYNATIGTATLAYSVDMFDPTKTQATQVYMPVGTRILICAKASTDPAGTGNYFKISFGDNNMFDNYYVLMSTVAFADFYKTPGIGEKVTYDASTIATIANNVIVDPGTGSQIGTEIEDPTIAIRAAINVSSAEVYSGFEPADRVVVGRLYRGTEVTIVSRKHEGYYQLRLDNGTVCWIRYDYVTALGKAPVTAPTLDVKLYTTTKATYLRKSAASRGTVISRLAKSTKLFATGEEKNGYVRVKTITGTLGWILKTCVTDYRIKLDTSSDIQAMATIKSKAKFLKTDKKTGKLMSTLKVGTEVIVLEEARNGFVKVMLINGKEGFVLASKLGEAYDANVDLPSTGSSTEIKYHKINVSRLNVYNLPSYAGSTVIATLKANESVFVEYEIKDGNGNLWKYIELPDGSHGYVYGISTLLFI